VSLMLVLDLLLFGVVGLAVWAVQMVWIPFWAAGVINGLGHFWGYRNFTCSDASTNLLPWGILIGGEELHNNHHAFATSARLSNKWYEFDIGWFYIRLMEVFGQARVKKVAPRPRLAALRSEIDAHTLQAVITHRYDLLTRYTKSLRQVYREELKVLQGRLAAVEWRQFRELQDWLAADQRQMPADVLRRFEALMAHNDHLKTLLQMRQELISLWERSNATREQLLAQLQDWCQRAESSGVQQLRELSLRLRRYAV